MLLSNQGPATSRQVNGGFGTLADRATSAPSGAAIPYADAADRNRTIRGSGLRIGEHTAWRIRLDPWCSTSAT